MTRLEKILVHGGTIATGVTGLAYAAFKHLMTSDDPFSAYSHPLQPWTLTLHVLAAPVLVFGVGIIFKDHVMGKMKNGAPPSAKRGGLWTLSLVLPLILTGYLVQVLASGGPRDWTGWIHLGLGVAFLVFYALHLAGAFRLKAEKERRSRMAPLQGDADPAASFRAGSMHAGVPSRARSEAPRTAHSSSSDRGASVRGLRIGPRPGHGRPDARAAKSRPPW